MPKLSQFAIKAAMLYLVVGAVWGAGLLAECHLAAVADLDTAAAIAQSNLYSFDRRRLAHAAYLWRDVLDVPDPLESAATR